MLYVVSHMDSNEFGSSPLVHSEISVIPVISSRGDKENAISDSGMSKYIVKAFDAIRKIEGINVVLTSMGRILRQEILQKY